MTAQLTMIFQIGDGGRMKRRSAAQALVWSIQLPNPPRYSVGLATRLTRCAAVKGKIQNPPMMSEAIRQFLGSSLRVLFAKMAQNASAVWHAIHFAWIMNMTLYFWRRMPVASVRMRLFFTTPPLRDDLRFARIASVCELEDLSRFRILHTARC